MDCIATAEQIFTQQQQIYRGNKHVNDVATLAEWNDFIRELKRRETVEKARMEARYRHRERQRTLAANDRSNPSNNGNQRGGLGRVEEGVGYFPSLAVLQFQSSIPGPSPSVAEYENMEKERLNRIMKWMSLIVFLYFLLS
ncbi:hypothetical protein ACHAXR_012079 [Thalassiosira sp. AJA248-18]